MAGHHHHVDPGAGDRRIVAAVGVNLLLTVAQIVGGIFSGSLALIADAIHNLSDALALVIAFGARKIARRPADKAMTFGYARAEVVAALINYTTLIVIGIWLVYEGIARLITPAGVDGWLVIWIAALALVIDLVTAALTFAMSKDSMNIRAAFLHNVSDALGSVGVIVAGVLILTFGWTWVDPVVTLAIAGYILWQSLTEIGPVIRLLMLGSPVEADADAIVADMRAVDGVADVHHVHLWMIDEARNAVDAHVVVAEGDWNRADAVKDAVRAALSGHGVSHATLEIECSRHACRDQQLFGSKPAARAGHGAVHAHVH
ncbi:cation diffusion facilitator family transporter [Loktanella sp. M215]|uniref:cation diffusion facilitator family transporter n=1 Tax=Loktanella sp. M215 TaxID=2675431 RepID=UPI001F300957|nr:cation diffusion facilitator family transporter [Loktanella sp. M215]MCF7699569.1 cation diffusion facilitator family transporter [Loktanella sp. M215]